MALLQSVSVSLFTPTQAGWLAEEREEPNIPETPHRVATRHTTQSQCRIEALTDGRAPARVDDAGIKLLSVNTTLQ